MNINHGEELRDRKTYEQFRDSLIKMQTEEEAAKKNNENYCKKIEAEIESLKAADSSIVELHGIDLNFVLTIDLEKLVADEEYYLEVQAKINTEVEKLYNILEDAFNTN